MKKLALLIVFATSVCYAQVGINNTNPNASLDITASSVATPTNTDGILIPRIDDFPVTNPTVNQDGMMVFVTGAGVPSKGFYYWDDGTTSWVAVGGGSVATKIDDLSDGKSDTDGTEDGSSLFIGINAGAAVSSSDKRNVGIGFETLTSASSGKKMTAMGYQALFSSNSIFVDGSSAFGYQSLYSNTTGSKNTAFGYQSLYSNTTGFQNTAFGYQSLYSNVGNGRWNTAFGYSALYANTTGSSNAAFGHLSLEDNTTGQSNTGLGDDTLKSNTIGDNNTASGNDALRFNISGDQNTANGSSSLRENTTGQRNTAMGYTSLNNNTTGDGNTAIGYLSIQDNISGNYNTAVGYTSLQENTTGGSNVAIGSWALEHNLTGVTNTANGVQSLQNNTSGNNNTAVGLASLLNNLTGEYNTAIGVNAFFTGTVFSNSTALGYNAEPNASNTIRVGNASVTTIGGYANWTNVSDGRFKTNVKENVKGLDFILKLRPVTYNFDMDAIARFNKTPDNLRLKAAERLKSAEIQSGFIAQEVEKTANEIGYDFHGIDKPKNENAHYGLRYAEFVVPLVKAVQEQQIIIEEQKLKIENLEKRLQKIEAILENKQVSN